MRLRGNRKKVMKWVHGSRCVVRVEVEGVLAPDMSEGLVFEPETVQFLDELQRLVDAGDADRLLHTPGVGEVFVRKTA